MTVAASGQGDFFGDQPPSFAPPDPRADRIGVIDVGSNSVRLVVFDGHCRSPAVLFNEKVMCGLGADLGRTGRLSPEGVERAMRALARFAALAPQLRVGALAGVATAAVREAEDGSEFCARVRAGTGIRLRVASGADEARLSAKGVLFGNPLAKGVVVDLGGASMEFCRIEDGAPGQGLTTPLGPQRLPGNGRPGNGTGREIRRYLDTLKDTYALDGGTLYLVGGSWRALARAQMARTGYPLKVLHEYTLPAEEAEDLGAWAARSRPEKLAELPGVPSSRVGTMPVAGKLLSEILGALSPGRVAVSAFGLREGVCLDNIPEPLRKQDPLIAACREQETRRARAPGFGAELGPWVERLLAPSDRAEARLVRAVAHLADVTWRTHPDYRAQGCWETVTRNTITDIGHEGRVFMGTALVARYRGARKTDRVPASNLLDAAAEQRAQRVGLALRLGTVLSGSAPGVLPRCPVTREGDRLIVTVTGHARAFAGEEVEKRLGHLARALECDWRIVEG